MYFCTQLNFNFVQKTPIYSLPKHLEDQKPPTESKTLRITKIHDHLKSSRRLFGDEEPKLWKILSNEKNLLAIENYIKQRGIRLLYSSSKDMFSIQLVVFTAWFKVNNFLHRLMQVIQHTVYNQTSIFYIFTLKYLFICRL